MIGFAFVSGCKTTTIIHHGCYGFFGKSFTFCGFASLLLCLISTSVVKLRMPLHLNFGVLILISNSSLNKSSCGTPLSASVFALECRGAMTCVAPPFELPYCFADENRLYTSRCVMNCPARDSNFRPMMRKITSFFKMSPSFCSLPERTRQNPEVTFHSVSYLIILITLAGTPPTMVFSGTSFPTTAPAATMAFSPMVTPANIVALAPIQAFFLMTMGLVSKECLVSGSSG